MISPADVVLRPMTFEEVASDYYSCKLNAWRGLYKICTLANGACLKCPRLTLKSQNFNKQVITNILTIPFAKPMSAFFKQRDPNYRLTSNSNTGLKCGLRYEHRGHERRRVHGTWGEADMMIMRQKTNCRPPVLPVRKAKDSQFKGSS